MGSGCGERRHTGHSPAVVRAVQLLVVLGLGSSCATASFELSGHAAADGRVFVLPPRYTGQQQGLGVSLVVEPQVKLKSNDGTHTLVARPFYRLDSVDERRSHFDVREAKYRLAHERFELTVGSDVLSWGVLESNRPGDVINQLDFVEAFNGSAKLGQPMVELGWVGSNAALRFYALPYFRERTFPGVKGRLRFPIAVDVEHADYESPLKQFTPSGAIRFTLNAGDVDLGVSAFGGVSREPRFIASLAAASVVPRYDMAYQASFDVQWTRGPLSLKAEGFGRLWTQKLVPFFGGGVGADYTFFGFAGDADLTLALEGLVDTRPAYAPPTFFDHDAFAALRLALNDVASTEFTVGTLVDVLTAATFVTLEGSRRFGEHWRLSLSASAFFGRPGTLQTSFVSDHFGQASLAYYF